LEREFASAAGTRYLGGEVLVQPSIRELEWELTRKGLR
jgi:hypothetical protein